MKKVITFFLLFAVILTCASCNKISYESSVPTLSESDKASATDAAKVLSSEKETAVRDNCYEEDSTALMSDTADDFRWANHEYSAEKDGILLKVSAPKNVVPSIEFEVIATVTNNSRKDITFTIPFCADNTHTEIRVKITDGENSFTDNDIHGKSFPELTKDVTIKSGESYTQTMHFMPGRYTSDILGHPDALFENCKDGEYTGTATFYWHKAEGEYDTNSISVEFPVTLLSRTATMIPT